MLELKCQHCGETFVAKRRDAKWCSVKCKSGHIRSNDPEKARERNRAYYHANIEKCRAQGRARHAANPEKSRAYQRTKREADPEKYRAYQRARREAYPEKIREQKRASYAANPEKYRERCLEKHRERRRRNAEAQMIEFLVKGEGNDR